MMENKDDDIYKLIKNKQIIYPVYITLTILFIGTIGYPLILNTYTDPYSYFDAFYMTIITISSVGFGEVIAINEHVGARILTIFIIIGGVGNLLYVLSSITSIMTNNKLLKFLRRRKTVKNISNMKNHYIICGAGTSARDLISELVDTGEEIVVIERNPEIIEWLSHKYQNLNIVEGDATEDDVLLEAGIQKAIGLGCVLPSDRDNLFLIVTAKQLNSNCRIISKALDPINAKKLQKAGATSTVLSFQIGALRLASELVRPNVVRFLDSMLKAKGNIRVNEYAIPKNSQYIGKRFGDINIRQEIKIQIMAIQDNNQQFTYHIDGDTKIKEGLILFYIGNKEIQKRVATFFE